MIQLLKYIKKFFLKYKLIIKNYQINLIDKFNLKMNKI
jgi:hypothetical protein